MKREIMNKVRVTTGVRMKARAIMRVRLDMRSRMRGKESTIVIELQGMGVTVENEGKGGDG